MHLLGNPQSSLRTIHIAGTKGKGSACAFIASILREAGFKVGLYTSPHLIDVRERIRIGEKITKKDFARLIEKIKPYAEKLRETELGRLSYYEILTACAFLYFKQAKVDFAVLETGLGGRLDATNTVSSLVCAITPISYEHTRVLGATLREIAAEKAGIIKTKSQIVICAPQRKEALEVIRKRAKAQAAKLFEVGKDIRIKEKRSSLYGQSFDIEGIFGEYPELKIRLLGEHQLINAAVAIGCIEALAYFDVEISHGAIARGLKKASWAGRLQIVSRKPTVVFDGAHNQASAFALKEALIKSFRFRNLILVFGVCQDKDVRGILKELVPLANKIILTKAANPRAMDPEAARAFMPIKRPVTLCENSIQALKIAREDTREKDLILVCGSLFLLGELFEKERQWKSYI